MIISHKFKFIFIKTRKTAGTSVEVYLSQHCGADDVVTPISPPIAGHKARNYIGRWNLLRELPEWIEEKPHRSQAIGQWLRGQRYFNHMSARTVRMRCPKLAWDNYLKFTIDRDPYEKVMSQFARHREYNGEAYDLDTYFREAQLPLNFPLYTDRDEGVMVDRILRYENLNKEIGQLFKDLGVPWGGTLNVHAKSGFRSDRRPARVDLPETYKERIREVFASEFTVNGYSI